jgi:hypothetical protein
MTRGVDEVAFAEERMRQGDAFLAEHRPWDVADVLVAGALGQPAHNGRYGNVVTARGPVKKGEPSTA